MPSLHQLNLRGCPLADLPDYQVQLLQQLPMLDVLDSKKVHKSGAVRSAKPAVAAFQPTEQTAQQIAGSQAPTKPDASSDKVPGRSHVKSQKRGLRQQEEESDAPKLKKVRKESLAVSAGVGGNAAGKEPATAPRVDEARSNVDAADVETAEKKRKSKGGKRSEQQVPPVDSSRSFLADVLDPAKSEIATKPADKAEGHQAPVENVTAVASDAKSGLVKVVDVQKATKSKKAKRGKGVESKDEKNKASGVSGSSAGQLLQSGLGLNGLQVGLGGSGAWD